MLLTERRGGHSEFHTALLTRNRGLDSSPEGVHVRVLGGIQPIPAWGREASLSGD